MDARRFERSRRVRQVAQERRGPGAERRDRVGGERDREDDGVPLERAHFGGDWGGVYEYGGSSVALAAAVACPRDVPSAEQCMLTVIVVDSFLSFPLFLYNNYLYHTI